MKTAEEILKSKGIDNTGSRAVRDRYILDAMYEFAEQAWREERERHSKLLAFAREQVVEMKYPGVAFKEALSAAGYEGKEQQ